MKLFLTTISILALVTTSCATGSKPPTFKREYSAVDTKDFKFEDKNISFTYTPVTFGSSIPVVFVNKSDRPIKIIWDETTFINSNGQSEKVIHEGVRIAERNASMTPSLIPPKASLSDSITPISRISWGGTSWEYQMICGQQSLIPFKGFEQKDEECVGKIFGFYITYQIENTKRFFQMKYILKSRQKSI